MAKNKLYTIQYRDPPGFDQRWGFLNFDSMARSLGITAYEDTRYYRSFVVSGKEAAQIIDQYKSSYQYEFRVFVVPDDWEMNGVPIYNWLATNPFKAWIEREAAIRQPTPWDNAEWFKNLSHYVCPQMTADGYVRYFCNMMAAIGNKPYIVSVGSFLRQYSNLSNGEIEAEVVRLDTTPCEIKFAVTAEEIKYVYQNGPNSCMSKPDDCYTFGSPVVAYGDSDFQVVYMIRNDKITARAVVSPDRKLYACIYGDAERFKPRLAQLGYQCSNSSGIFDGLRIRKIVKTNSWGKGCVIPFIDTSNTLTDIGDWLEINSRGHGHFDEGATSGFRNYSHSSYCKETSAS